MESNGGRVRTVVGNRRGECLSVCRGERVGDFCEFWRKEVGWECEGGYNVRDGCHCGL